MPFETDTKWPDRLVTIFTVSRRIPGSLEDCYSGPYDKMLNYCFGEGFDFFVAPQVPPADETRKTVIYLLVLDKNGLPVLIIEVRDDSHHRNPSKRDAADTRIRSRFDELLFTCPLPTLHGLSLLGTRMRVYTGNTASMELIPPNVERPATGRVLDPSFLANQWDLDILSDDGFRKIKEIVGFIKHHGLGGA
ncbi:hypothetical protein DFH07DRAFT_1055407 [Mycena maculata]|uniref:Uncharacterized protein n=1 Tax=Mycena maculata TaxID=230809 RepID=A0AAD7NZV8_9AGAR|nr:hypothetical protein DFH07DRAFT_1055407 [Mycena maculata]